MDQRSLTVTIRTEFKKGQVGRLRKKNKIPAIIYGHNDPLPITVDEHDFNTTFKQISESTLINLDMGKDKYNVLVKDFQEDIISGKIIHIDFYEVEKGKLLRTHIPIHFQGAAAGSLEGGVFEAFLHELEVECFPKNLPESYNLDISGLDIGNSIHVRDLETVENVKILNSEDQVVCLVARSRIAEEIAPVEEELEEEEAVEGVAEESEVEKEE